MTPQPTQQQIEGFRSFLTDHFGLRFNDARLEFLTDVLDTRIKESKCADFASYMANLHSHSISRQELRVLAELLTVSETFFYRYPQQFTAFVEEILPEMLRSKEASREIRVLCAGCSSGEEPYTIAMLLLERIPNLSDWKVCIHGIDINRTMLAKARKGKYRDWSMRAIPESMRRRHFDHNRDDYLVSEPVRSLVSFAELNLTDDAPEFWERDRFDVVFCRNVLIYFSDAAARQVLRRLAQSIRPGGYLFLGPADALQVISADFRRCSTHDVIYYQRRYSAPERSIPEIAGKNEPESAALATGTSSSVSADQAWLNVVQDASRRSSARSRANLPAADQVSIEVNKTHEQLGPTWNLDPLIAALTEERLEEARRHLRSIPPAARSDDPDIQLLSAVVFANSGDVGAAETALRLLLAGDDLHPGAHYLLGLCREHRGAIAEAKSHHECAVYLDPSFALAHHQLGRLARRAGDLKTATREFRHALDLVSREHPTRISLFGGGFPREVLRRFCQNELSAIGENT